MESYPAHSASSGRRPSGPDDHLPESIDSTILDPHARSAAGSALDSSVLGGAIPPETIDPPLLQPGFTHNPAEAFDIFGEPIFPGFLSAGDQVPVRPVAHHQEIDEALRCHFEAAQTLGDNHPHALSQDPTAYQGDHSQMVGGVPEQHHRLGEDVVTSRQLEDPDFQAMDDHYLRANYESQFLHDQINLPNEETLTNYIPPSFNQPQLSAPFGSFGQQAFFNESQHHQGQFIHPQYGFSSQAVAQYPGAHLYNSDTAPHPWNPSTFAATQDPRISTAPQMQSTPNLMTVPAAASSPRERKICPECKRGVFVSPVGDYERCPRCQGRKNVRSAGPPTVAFNAGMTIANAKALVFPAAQHDFQQVPGDDWEFERQQENAWVERFVVAACTPVVTDNSPGPSGSQNATTTAIAAHAQTGASVSTQHQVDQQRKLNKAFYHHKTTTYREEMFNARMRILFHCAARFHNPTTPLHYPIGGDNQGYKPDYSMRASERLSRIENILRWEKRIVMDVLEGRGVLGFASHPSGYGHRKKQNKQGNEKKQAVLKADRAKKMREEAAAAAAAAVVQRDEKEKEGEEEEKVSDDEESGNGEEESEEAEADEEEEEDEEETTQDVQQVLSAAATAWRPAAASSGSAPGPSASHPNPQTIPAKRTFQQNDDDDNDAAGPATHRQRMG